MLTVVVLGNKLNDDGSISQIMFERLNLACAIDKLLAPQKIVLSGGVANPKAGLSEAEAMRRFLSAGGVDEQKLVLETRSLTTKQNAKFSVPIAAELGTDKLLLCTSPEHMRRSYLNPVKLFIKQLKNYPNIKLLTCCCEEDLTRLSVRQE